MIPNKVQEPNPNPTQAVSIAELSLEHHHQLLGIGEATPRISWIVQTDLQNWQQAAYEIEVSRADGTHSSGRIDSSESVLQPWPFAPLRSREQVQLRGRVWGQDGSSSGWSEVLEAEAGLLSAEDWQAQFVGPTWAEDLAKLEPNPYLRHEFELHGSVQKARLYVSALGVYEPYINGKAVGDQVLAPGWTSYTHRLRYQTFDVTGLLVEGRNALGALLGDGWYRGRLGFGGGRRNIYGSKLGLLAQLEVEYQDGSSQTIASNQDWKAHKSPILASGLYEGETYDARLELPGWSEPGFADSDWTGVQALEHDLRTLIAPSGPPVRRIETIAPVAITASPSGKTLVDFGQNLVGRLRIKVQGQAGHTVTLRHAEVLEHGELGTRPLRHASATDRYTLRGDGLEVWEPRFTFHGFRYAEVENWPGELGKDDLEAIVLHSDMERTGWFECSDPLINQLHQNVVWGMRGNFLDVPTDCPQRDERLGWTGDIQVFAPTATFLYDCAGFLESWLADLAAEQNPEGIVPFIVPNVLPAAHFPSAAWSDAATVVPWVLYERYRDEGILAAQYASMKAWVDYLAALTGERRLWDTGMQFGDWLDPTAPPDQPGAAKTHPAIVATAYFVRSAELLGKAAGVLGRSQDEAKYLALADEVRAAFACEYVTPGGRMVSDAPTAYTLALEFALLPEPAQRHHAGQRLLELVRESGYHISTGFVGTPLICDALCNAGAPQAAFRLLTQTECPSWLYPVTMGATTVWERWDSMLPDGSINPGEMTSFNHYALGAVADWLHRTVAGLAPLEPGYRRLEVSPKVGGGLTQARASHKTPYGLAEVGWRLEREGLELTAVIPANTTARVVLPGGETHLVGSGSHRWVVTHRNQPPSNLSLDSTLDEVLDDAKAYALVKQVLHQHAPESNLVLGAILRQNGKSRLGEAVGMLPRAEELRKKLGAVLSA